MRRRPRLRALAERMGIALSYRAIGGETRSTSEETAVSLLAAMGLDASSEATAKSALRELAEREARRTLEPVCVAVEGRRAAGRVEVRLPARAARPTTWRLELRAEEGAESHAEGRVGSGAAILSLRLPAPLGPGYHDLRVFLESGSACDEARQRRIVVPRRCAEVDAALAGQRGFGLTANLYTLRSQRNWGAGDFADLGALLRFAGERGAAFVGVNPLHFLWNRGEAVSPYAPVSRLFRNPLYLDVEAVPELAHDDVTRAQLASRPFRSRLEAARAARALDYEAVAGLKREILEPLHRRFAARHRGQPTPRGRAYARYREAQGDALDDFATYLALADHFAGAEPGDWREWPDAYRDPRSREVEQFRKAHAERVDFHRFLQFELDRQLAACARSGGEAGVSLGVFEDLALGSTPGGADTWMFRDVFTSDVRMGAPPDAFSSDGQDWGLPPLDPRTLRERGYDYWIRVLRASCAHAGALRIDHAMALTRLYWIPSGHPPKDGAYVRYPAAELFGILALESQRCGTVAIGEDLGTVPTGFAAQLARWGVLSWRVLYFERHRRGFRAARHYSPRALVTANTHDLAPLAGFACGRDLELRRRVGAIESDAALAAARAERDADCRSLARRLVREDLLARGAELPAPPALGTAVHAFLSRTPAPLVGISLDDLAGETEPVHLPGTAPDAFPHWRRRMGLALESLDADPGVGEGLRAVQQDRRLRR